MPRAGPWSACRGDTELSGSSCSRLRERGSQRVSRAFSRARCARDRIGLVGRPVPSEEVVEADRRVRIAGFAGSPTGWAGANHVRCNRSRQNSRCVPPRPRARSQREPRPGGVLRQSLPVGVPRVVCPVSPTEYVSRCGCARSPRPCAFGRRWSRQVRGGGNLHELGIEASRSWRGACVWAPVKELGRDGIVDMVGRCCELAQELAARCRPEGWEYGARAPGSRTGGDRLVAHRPRRSRPPSSGRVLESGRRPPELSPLDSLGVFPEHAASVLEERT
jgi:hypothetical protein